MSKRGIKLNFHRVRGVKKTQVKRRGRKKQQLQSVPLLNTPMNIQPSQYTPSTPLR